MAEGTSRLVAAQWAGATRLRAIIDAGDRLAAAEIDAPVARVEAMLDLATAEGVWLDRLGDRLGVARPLADIPTDYFGFAGAGVGFDLAPFRDDSISRPKEPVGDNLYRAILRARGRALRGRGTAADVLAAAREIDLEAAVEDGGDLTATIRTRDTTAMQLARDAGALGIPAGVGVAIAEFAPPPAFFEQPDPPRRLLETFPTIAIFQYTGAARIAQVRFVAAPDTTRYTASSRSGVGGEQALSVGITNEDFDGTRVLIVLIPAAGGDYANPSVVTVTGFDTNDNLIERAEIAVRLLN